MKTLKNKWRRRRLASAGIDVEIDIATTRFGIGPGAWVTHPAGLDASSIIYSVGIGDNITFDLDLIDRLGVTVHAFDPTPASVAWVREQCLPENFVFHDVGLADFDGELAFHVPRKAASFHFTPVQRYRKAAEKTVQAPVRRLSSLMRELGHERIDLLKIDIEGGEYAILRDLAAHPLPIRQLLIEFHHNYPAIPFRHTLEAVRSLRAMGFRVFAISERTYEMSFLHRDVG